MSSDKIISIYSDELQVKTTSINKFFINYK